MMVASGTRMTAVTGGGKLRIFLSRSSITSALIWTCHTMFMADFRTTVHGWVILHTRAELQTVAGKIYMAATASGLLPILQIRITSTQSIKAVGSLALTARHWSRATFSRYLSIRKRNFVTTGTLPFI